MILDACCGALMMYHRMHKNLGDQFIYIDIRKMPEHKYRNWNRSGYTIKEIKPMILADMKHLPFRDNIFDAIIFDPPHLDTGLQSFMAEKYGSWGMVDTVRHLRAVNTEFPRVLRHGGLLLLKMFHRRFYVYKHLLTSFTFFLPVVFRSQSHLSSEKVGWYVALMKKLEP